MGLTHTALKGRITISSSNNRIDWYEENVGPGYDLNTTVTTGVYWPDALATAIAAAMTTESGSSGASLTYTAAIDNDTGVVSISSDAGSWYPKLTTSESNKILTGGDATAGQLGDDHMGWTVDSSSPSGATIHTSDQAHSNAWYPTAGTTHATLKEDDQGILEGFAIEAHSLGRTTQAYSFGPSTRGEDPGRVRTLEYEFVSDASRTQYVDEFWKAYAQQGLPDGRFRFYPDRSDTGTYVLYGLTGESLQRAAFSRSTPGIARWSITLNLKRYQE